MSALGLAFLGAGAPAAQAAFPGQNGKIVFERSTNAVAYRGTSDIYSMNADGTGLTNLTNDPADNNAAPRFSADGNKIVFASNRNSPAFPNPGNDQELYIMNSDGSGLTRVTDNTADDVDPSFSPDGKKIVFAQGAQGDYLFDIYTVNVDGSGEQPLTTGKSAFGSPAFSPDGTKIAFNASNYTVSLMNADGSNLTVPAPGSDTCAGCPEFPNFSPDGTKIAFDYDRDHPFYNQVFVMNPDGSGQTPLTNDQKTLSYQAAFSPDGKKIVYIHDFDPYNDNGIGQHRQLYVMNADGTGQTEMTNAPLLHDLLPDWQPAPDGDRDGVPDASDQCPSLAGPASNAGCPVSASATSTSTAGTPTPDVFAPGVTNYGVTNSVFAVGGGSTPTFGFAARRHKKGTTFRYALSEAATVRIVIAQRRSGRRRGRRCVAPTRNLRHARRCARLVVKGTLTRLSRRGANSVAFSGRIGSRALAPGRYQATLTATDAAGNTSRGKAVSFTIVKR